MRDDTEELDSAQDADSYTARRLLGISDFRRLWLADSISSLGDGLTSLALLLLVNDLTGSPGAVATMAIAIALPQIALGVVAGVYVDRWNRKRTLVFSNIARALLVMIFVIAAQTSQVTLLYTVAALQSAVSAFFEPARTALVPRIVPSSGLLSANAMSQFGGTLFTLLGTAIAGFMVAWSGQYGLLFSIDALSFILAGLLLSSMSVDGRVSKHVEPSRRLAAIRLDLLAGFGLIRNSQTLRGCLIALTISMLGMGAVNVLMVPFLVNELRVSTSWFGAIEASQTIAMIASSILIATIAERLFKPLLIAVGLIGLGSMTVALAIAGSVWHVLAVLFLLGWFVPPIQTTVSTLVQMSVADDFRGRVGGALNGAVGGAGVVSMALSGILASILSVRGVFALAGVLTVAAGIVSYQLLKKSESD